MSSGTILEASDQISCLLDGGKHNPRYLNATMQFDWPCTETSQRREALCPAKLRSLPRRSSADTEEKWESLKKWNYQGRRLSASDW